MTEAATHGRVPKWPKGTGCKPVDVRLPRFESWRAQFTSVRSDFSLFASIVGNGMPCWSAVTLAIMRGNFGLTKLRKLT